MLIEASSRRVGLEGAPEKVGVSDEELSSLVEEELEERLLLSTSRFPDWSERLIEVWRLSK